MNTARPAPGLGVRLAQALGVAVVSLGMAVFRFRAWEQSFSVPLTTAATDDLQIAAIVRSIRETGWYFTNPRLGAPFGQQLYDFPHAGESLQLGVIRFLTLFSVRPYWVMNVYFLIGFAALAFVSFLVLAHLRFRAGVAAVVALLYTWLPYHFMHGEFHLFRSAYLSAPLGVLLIFWVLSWKDRFLIEADGPVWGPRRLAHNLRWPRVWGAVAVCVFVGAFETMTMAFVLVALVVSAAIAAVAGRDGGILGAALVAVLLIAATFAVLFIPNYAYKASHGPNTQAAARIPAEQIRYGLQISKMVLPVAGHHIGPLGRLMPRSQEGNPLPGEGGQNLGLLGTLGFLGLLYGVIVHRFDVRVGEELADRRRLWTMSGVVGLVLVLFATMSGFALVLSTLGLSQIRVWDRAVVLIAFCAMVVVAIALESIVARVERRVVGSEPIHAGRGRGARLAVGCTLGAVLVFGLWDTSVPYASSRTNAAQNVRALELRRLDDTIAARLGSEAMLFQLPVIPYPEEPPRNGMDDYEGLLPYLYSVKLRFSYGATKGRPDADWQLRVDSEDPSAALAGLAGLGFDGVLVDTHGYADHGVAITARLDATLGPPVVTSTSGRWLVWSLRDLPAKHRLGRADLDSAAARLAPKNN